MAIRWEDLHQQDLFDFDDPDIYKPLPRPKKKKQPVDYERIYHRLLQGPMTFKDIEEMTGIAHCGVAQVITTLSLRYPVYSPSRGVYKLYGDEEYGDGINHEALKGYEAEM